MRAVVDNFGGQGQMHGMALKGTVHQCGTVSVTRPLLELSLLHLHTTTGMFRYNGCSPSGTDSIESRNKGESSPPSALFPLPLCGEKPH